MKCLIKMMTELDKKTLNIYENNEFIDIEDKYKGEFVNIGDKYKGEFVNIEDKYKNF